MNGVTLKQSILDYTRLVKELEEAGYITLKGDWCYDFKSQWHRESIHNYLVSVTGYNIQPTTRREKYATFDMYIDFVTGAHQTYFLLRWS